MKSVVACAAVLGSLTHSDAGLVTITTNYVRSDVYEQNVPSDVEVYSGTSIPADEFLEAATGSSYSITNLTFTESSAQTIFSYDLDQQRIGTFGSYARSYVSYLYFTANQNTSYDLSGFYDVDDVSDTEHGEVVLEVTLFDQTAGQFLSRHLTISRNTNDESFVLGDPGGDVSNAFSGNLTGDLIDGHQYRFHYIARILSYPYPPDEGASAIGNITLKIGPDAAVPEPASIALFGLSSLGVGIIARRRKTQIATVPSGLTSSL